MKIYIATNSKTDFKILEDTPFDIDLLISFAYGNSVVDLLNERLGVKYKPIKIEED